MSKTKISIYQRALFKEQARSIVAEDRYARKNGRSQNTIGEIERALVNAYLLGKDEREMNDLAGDTGAEPTFVQWIEVPPRGRDALWTISISISGIGHAAKDLMVNLRREGQVRPRWHWINDGESRSFSNGAVAPLIRLGLLAIDHADQDIAFLTPKGIETCREFWRRWNSGDSTLPVMSLRP